MHGFARRSPALASDFFLRCQQTRKSSHTDLFEICSNALADPALHTILSLFASAFIIAIIAVDSRDNKNQRARGENHTGGGGKSRRVESFSSGAFYCINTHEVARQRGSALCK
jgi:hypothetical protein